jgi:hypothetical protein
MNACQGLIPVALEVPTTCPLLLMSAAVHSAPNVPRSTTLYLLDNWDCAFPLQDRSKSNITAMHEQFMLRNFITLFCEVQYLDITIENIVIDEYRHHWREKSTHAGREQYQ